MRLKLGFINMKLLNFKKILPKIRCNSILMISPTNKNPFYHFTLLYCILSGGYVNCFKDYKGTRKKKLLRDIAKRLLGLDFGSASGPGFISILQNLEAMRRVEGVSKQKETKFVTFQRQSILNTDFLSVKYSKKVKKNCCHW